METKCRRSEALSVKTCSSAQALKNGEERENDGISGCLQHLTSVSVSARGGGGVVIGLTMMTTTRKVTRPVCYPPVPLNQLRALRPIQLMGRRSARRALLKDTSIRHRPAAEPRHRVSLEWIGLEASQRPQQPTCFFFQTAGSTP